MDEVERAKLEDWARKNYGWETLEEDDYDLIRQSMALAEGNEGAIRLTVDEHVQRRLDGAFAQEGLGAAVTTDGERKIDTMVSLTPTAKERLTDIAFQMGFIRAGKGNISGLIEAIGRGNVILRVRGPYTKGDEDVDEIVRENQKLLNFVSNVQKMLEDF